MDIRNFGSVLVTQYQQDALTNQFEVILSLLPNSLKQSLGADFADELGVRILTISIPPQAISTYEVTKRGRKFSRPAGVADQAYEFNFSYRIDKNFKAYRLLSDWLKIVQSPVTMGMGEDVGLGQAGIRGVVTVHARDSFGNIKATWTMQGVLPKEQASVEFDENTGEPLVINMTMHFLNILYPTLITLPGAGVIESPQQYVGLGE